MVTGAQDPLAVAKVLGILLNVNAQTAVCRQRRLRVVREQIVASFAPEIPTLSARCGTHVRVEREDAALPIEKRHHFFGRHSIEYPLNG